MTIVDVEAKIKTIMWLLIIVVSIQYMLFRLKLMEIWLRIEHNKSNAIIENPSDQVKID